MVKKKTSRRAMKENPLDSILGTERKGAAVKASRRGLVKTGTVSPPEPKPQRRKERATFHLDADLYEEIRNAVVFLMGPPAFLTLTGFAESAFRAELERLKKKHAGGKGFPKRGGEPRTGRPISRR